MNIQCFDNLLNKMEQDNSDLYNHSERVAILCYATAKKMKLSDKEKEISYCAGLLHDIGRFYLENIQKSLSNNLSEDLIETIYPLINGAIICSNTDFINLLPILIKYNDSIDTISEYTNNNENLIRVILQIADKYDYLRIKNISHQNVCKELRNIYVQHNNLVTFFLQAIIENGLNLDY